MLYEFAQRPQRSLIAQPSLDPIDFHLELMDFTQENGNENMGVILDLPANTS